MKNLIKYLLLLIMLPLLMLFSSVFAEKQQAVTSYSCKQLSIPPVCTVCADGKQTCTLTERRNEFNISTTNCNPVKLDPQPCDNSAISIPNTSSLPQCDNIGTNLDCNGLGKIKNGCQDPTKPIMCLAKPGSGFSTAEIFNGQRVVCCNTAPTTNCNLHNNQKTCEDSNCKWFGGLSKVCGQKAGDIQTSAPIPTATPTQTQTAKPSLYWTQIAYCPAPTPTPTPSQLALAPTNTPTPTTSPLVAISPTATPTPTPTPTAQAAAPTATPTPTPIPGSYLLALSVKADGIGILSGENKSPRRQNRRSATITIRYPNAQETITKSGALNYSTATGTFTGIIDMGTELSSDIQTDLISIKMDVLKGFAPNIKLKQGINAPPQITMRIGLDDDNNIDSVTYYEILRSCFNGRTSCKNLQEADINDDGKADGIDYNIFIKSIQFISSRST